MKAAVPARQTTLAFATKAGNKEADKVEDEGSEADASTKENSDPEKGETFCHSPNLSQSIIVDSCKKIPKNACGLQKRTRKQSPN